MNKPAWLKRGILVCHLPTATVFVPERLYDRAGTKMLTDPSGTEWKLSECDQLRFEHLRKGGTFAGQVELAIYPDARGLVVSNGTRKTLVKLWEPVSAEAAARSLASAFDGSIYSEEARS